MRLVLGQDGSIGSYLCKNWTSQDIEVLGTSRNPINPSNHQKRSFFLDLESEEAPNLGKNSFHVVVVAAGLTRIHECDNDSEKARRINVDGTLRFINAVSERTQHLIFLSSSRVFDGQLQEPGLTEPANPNTIYGQNKSYVEQIIRDKYPSFTILRLSKILDEHSGLLQDWHRKVSRKEKISVFHDMYFTPTYLGDVAEAIENIIDQQKTGLHHLTPRRSVTYAAFAKYWCQKHDYDNTLLETASRPPEFPKYCCLG